MALALDQTLEVARRSFLRSLRQPAAVIPSLVFPLFLLAVNAAGLDAATKIPGFPTDSYLTFILAFPFIQGAIFALLNMGTDVATDIEGGLMNRLALTPIPGGALLAGMLGGALAVGLLQAVVYLTVGLAAGANFAAGAWGVPVLLLLSLVISFSFGCVGTFAALRVGDSEAMQSLFPVFFVFLFFSSASLPRDLLGAGWFKALATINPVSYMIEAIRSLFVVGWDAEALALGFGFSALIAVIFLTAASFTLRTRLVRG